MMVSSKLPRVAPFALVALVGALVLSAPAVADVTGVAFTIAASSVLGSGAYDVPASELTYDPLTGRYFWHLPLAVTIENDLGEPIATLTSANAVYFGDPVVALGFAVTAGAADTSFTIGSGLLSFAPLSPAQATASVGLTLTDSLGDGAWLAAPVPGGAVYHTLYNSGTPFADLFTAGLAVTGGSAAGNDAAPLQAITSPAFNMQANYGFVVSANDLASGTGNFLIIPEPGSLLTLLGVLLLARRR
ncbi:MAG: hypothetical protein KA383_04065 [Phycisphaerae bacterium]|nr:hypothetical protein [Phycisphaerae bacterium]